MGALQAQIHMEQSKQHDYEAQKEMIFEQALEKERLYEDKKRDCELLDV